MSAKLNTIEGRGSTPWAVLYYFFCFIGVFFLPFTKALSIEVGFPLKIYELAFVVSILPFLLDRVQTLQSQLRSSNGKDVISKYATSAEPQTQRVSHGLVWVLLMLLLVAASISTIWPVMTPPVSLVSFRGGGGFDSLSRVIYLAFNLVVVALVSHLFRTNFMKTVNIWLWGMSLSAGYLLLTCIFYLTKGDAPLLPGLERHQLLYLGGLYFPRSGTFEEGNFAGLYFLFSFALAVWCRRKWFALLAAVATILTFSTAAYLGLFVFLFFHFISRERSILIKVLTMVTLAVAGAGLFSAAGLGEKFENSDGASAFVRLNESLTGLKMFNDHPIFGVGLGQYGYLFDGYEWKPEYSTYVFADKRIANNVYVELLAELGLVGTIFFVLFWAMWLIRLARLRLRLFVSFGIGMFMLWLAYPTFNMTIVWCIAGFGLGIQSMNEGEVPLYERGQYGCC